MRERAMTFQTLKVGLANLSDRDVDMLEHSLDHYGCSNSIPNIYRVRDESRWQCEWDDLNEVGAFRSRWLGRCVRQAQKAREQWLRDQIAERRST